MSNAQLGTYRFRTYDDGARDFFIVEPDNTNERGGFFVQNNGSASIGDTNLGIVGTGALDSANSATIEFLYNPTEDRYKIYIDRNGTGSLKEFQFYYAGAVNKSIWSVPSSGSYFQFDTPTIHITSGQNSIFGTSDNFALLLQTNGIERIRISNTGVFHLFNSDATGATAGQMVITETTAPGNSGANKAIVFAQDNGSGKTQLAVRFNTGAVQILATEP